MVDSGVQQRMNAERYSRQRLSKHSVRSQAARSWDSLDQSGPTAWGPLFRSFPSIQCGVWPMLPGRFGGLPPPITSVDECLDLLLPYAGLLGPRYFWHRDPEVVYADRFWWVELC